MRLLICAGGTGGGVNPALAVLQALQTSSDLQTPKEKHDVLWVGGLGGMEADLVKRAGVPFMAIPAAGVHGVGPRALPGNLSRLSRGVVASRRILADFKPDVLFFTGGYVGVPMAVAGRLPGSASPRSLLFVPDIEPGLALKMLSRFSHHITGVVEDTRAYLPSNVPFTVTGYPLRLDLHRWEPLEARQLLGLSPDLPTLLILGGSRGARSINRAVVQVLPDLLDRMQVVHATGQGDWQEVSQAAQVLVERGLDAGLAGRYHPYPYLHTELGAALSVADLVISRAGASTLGEFPFFGVPAVLVPYPHAWRYQRVNAGYLVARGAAQMIDEASGDLANQLLPLVQSLMFSPGQLAGMRQAMQSLARPGAAQAIADILTDPTLCSGVGSKPA